MAIKGYSTTLGYSTVGAGSYTLIGKVMDVSGPSIVVDDIEITNNDSGADEFKEYIAGLRDAGDVTFDIIYEITQNIALQAIVGTLKDWQLTLPDSATYVFTGYIKEIGQETPMADAVKNNIAIKVTGKPTYASN